MRVKVVSGSVVLAVVIMALVAMASRVSAVDLDPPSSCTATFSGDGGIDVTWPAVVGAADYVVYRSVNGSPDYWRGRVTATSFNDTSRSGTIVYKVAAKAADGTISSRTICTTDPGPEPDPLDAPASCLVTTTPNGDYLVSWPAAQGAINYIVRRSVNGSPDYWRGRLSATSFPDSGRSGVVVYKVASVGADGTVTVGTECDGDVVNPPDPVSAPASCRTTDHGDSTVTVDWPSVEGAVDYVVYRTVNGSNRYWRGRTTMSSFDDTLRTGAVFYSVVARGVDGIASPHTDCTNGDGPQPIDADVVAFGDMARCGTDGATAVGNLLDVITQPIWGLGDYVYDDGTPEEFADCFDPKLGRHLPRFSPVAGNHEYNTPDAAGYFDYFGALAVDPTTGYYERTVGDWQVLFLNSNCFEVGGCGTGSAQYQWVEQHLAAPAGCRAAVFHHPRWSSSGPYADQANLDDLVRLLHGAGTDLLISGHAHHYERLARLDPDQQPDPLTGFRQFIVGTGGIVPRIPDPADRLAASEVLITEEYGVLALDLNSDSYGWEFIDIDGNVLDDGADNCIN